VAAVIPRAIPEGRGAPRLRPLGATATWAVFAAFGAALWAATRPGIAGLVRLGVRPDVAWFISGGCVFLGLLLTAAAALRGDGFTTLRAALEERCRLRRLGPRGWRSGNTWVGVVVHAAVNGPAFVAIALGLLSAWRVRTSRPTRGPAHPA
jgi:hypothetical protein